ncbi:MAG: hypothetical protein E5Y12_26570 [Mesorhizobium sp.]|nr:MAG: hypothetical protein E5Y12_26570 [Mesorhizobium sp.]
MIPHRWCSTAPPSGLPAISPSRGEIGCCCAFANLRCPREAPPDHKPVSAVTKRRRAAKWGYWRRIAAPSPRSKVDAEITSRKVRPVVQPGRACARG